MVWKLTPVKAGTYTVNYEISAGLYGNAKAVTSDGTQPQGKFVVTITDKPPTRLSLELRAGRSRVGVAVALARHATRRRDAAQCLRGGAAALAILTLAATGSAERQAQPEAKRGDGRGGVKLRKVGDFDSPVYIASARGFDDLLFIVEREGRIIVLRNGKRAGTFLDIPAGSRPRASAGCSRSPSRPTTSERPLLRLLTPTQRGDIEVDEFRRSSPAPPTRGRARSHHDPPPRGVQPQRRHSAFGPDGMLYIGDRRRRVRRRPRRTRRTRGSCSASCCASTRTAPASGGYANPQGNPFVGDAGRNEIFALGPAQPVPLLVRPQQTGRIAIGDVGQDIARGGRHRERTTPRGANFGWDTSRATTATTAGDNEARSQRAARRAARPRVLARPGQRDHRRRDGPRRRPEAARGPLRLRRLLRRRAAQFVPQLKRYRRAQRHGRSASRSGPHAVRLGEDRDGHVYVASLPTASVLPARPRSSPRCAATG